MLYKSCIALSKIWKLCFLLLRSQQLRANSLFLTFPPFFLLFYYFILSLPLTSFAEMKEVKTISSLGNSIMWKGGGRLINTCGLYALLGGQIFVSQMSVIPRGSARGKDSDPAFHF